MWKIKNTLIEKETTSTETAFPSSPSPLTENTLKTNSALHKR